MINDYRMFEGFVAKIFGEAGYSVTSNVRSEEFTGDIDVIAEKDDVKYCIEVKNSPINEKSIERTCAIAEKLNMQPVLVTAYDIGKKRQYYQEKYPNIELIDISNLMFAVHNRTQLYNELIAGLSYVVDEIKPQKGFIEINSLQHDNHTQSLINEMELCKVGKEGARDYEILCYELLENIFAEDLALWKEQQHSNKELYRFDLLCRIKDGNQKTFWSILERYFNSKYVIFEFKNYEKPITQKEIYTTEKYLYSKALRSVGILISQHGYNSNAYWAAKGCLRENGKLIILLDTDDLIKMNKMKFCQEDPSDYLLAKLDEILLELEK